MAAAPAAPARRTGYLEALAIYERGLRALQKHSYTEAADALRGVLERYPEEKELHERVRLYLNICERQEAPRSKAPQTDEERLYAATLATNAGQYTEALSHLRALSEAAENDHALYLRASVSAQLGQAAEAIACLQRAVDLNPENRSLARHDPDLDPIRHDSAFQALLEAPPVPRPARRRPARGRAAR